MAAGAVGWLGSSQRNEVTACTVHNSVHRLLPVRPRAILCYSVSPFRNAASAAAAATRGGSFPDSTAGNCASSAPRTPPQRRSRSNASASIASHVMRFSWRSLWRASSPLAAASPPNEASWLCSASRLSPVAALIASTLRCQPGTLQTEAKPNCCFRNNHYAACAWAASVVHFYNKLRLQYGRFK